MKPTSFLKVIFLVMSFALTQWLFADTVESVKQQTKKSTAFPCSATRLSEIKDSLVDNPSSYAGQILLLHSYVGNSALRINAALACVGSLQGALQPSSDDKNPDVINYKQEGLSAANALQASLQEIQASFGSNLNLNQGLEDTPVDPNDHTHDPVAALGIRG
jgi:hypothetical protein